MTTSGVRTEAAGLRIGDELIPLLSGEIQFWRMDPVSWRPALEAAKDAGFTMVATYLSWRRHEPIRGRFEWGGGDPRLDARAFVLACADAGLAVHLKPGPWICAEEPGGGYPDWLLADDDLAALDAWGNPVVGYNPPFLHRVPSYRHPGYRAAVRSWFAAVWDELGDLRHPDGPLAAVQLDNEPSHCFSEALYHADYHPLQVAAFRDWLGTRYPNDRALADSWHVPATLAAAQPPRPGDISRVLTGTGTVDRRLADWTDFCGDTITEHLQFLQRQHAELGAGDLLPTVNIINPPVFETPLSHSAVRIATGAATGVDHYYVPPLDLTDIDRLAKTAAFARLAAEPLVWSPELMAGIWRSPGEQVSYPDPTPAEQLAWWGAALALGYRGFNLYMLANRENWQYGPVGGQAAFLDAATRFARLLRDTPGVATADIVRPVALAWHRPDAVAAYCVTGTARSRAVHDEPAARVAYDAWAATAYDLLAADIPYDLVDTQQPVPPSEDRRPLLIPPHSGADETRLRRLGWQTLRRSPDEPIEHLVASGTIRRPVQLDSGQDRPSLATLASSHAATYLHIANWGSERPAAAVLDPTYPSSGWIEPATGQHVDLKQFTLRTGYSLYRRASRLE